MHLHLLWIRSRVLELTARWSDSKVHLNLWAMVSSKSKAVCTSSRSSFRAWTTKSITNKSQIITRPWSKSLPNLKFIVEQTTCFTPPNLKWAKRNVKVSEIDGDKSFSGFKCLKNLGWLNKEPGYDDWDTYETHEHADSSVDYGQQQLNGPVSSTAVGQFNEACDN